MRFLNIKANQALRPEQGRAFNFINGGLVNRSRLHETILDAWLLENFLKSPFFASGPFPVAMYNSFLYSRSKIKDLKMADETIGDRETGLQ